MNKTDLIITLAIGGLLGVNLGGCSVVDNRAATVFEQALGDTSITVFPAYVRDQDPHYEAAAARAIGDFFTDDELATVSLASAEVPITSVWGTDQSRMFRDSVEDFARYIRQNPIGTAYAALPEFLFGNDRVVGVHLYLVDAAGTCAYAVGCNSHHAVFQDVDPKTVEDATEVAVRQMRSELGQKGRTEAAKGGKLDSATSVTILPFRVGDRSRKDVADVVGLMLEREGMPHIFTVEADFLPPTGATLREVADAVAEYSRQHSFETDCVLYGEFLGAPGSGVDAVRGVLATARGDVVWSDEQTPADVAFRRVGPRNPMTCCVLFKERVGPQFRLSALTRARASEGRMAQLWEEKSHRPSKQELEKIQQRLRAMKDKGSDTTVAIYATQVSGRIDAASAENLARLLNERGLLTAAVADAAPQFEIEPSSNEQRRLWDLARAFREYVKTQPPAADYALLAEYTIRPSDGQVWTVHTIVCDSTGEWAMVDFQNEYQADFNRIAPRSCGDADRLVVERIAGYLQ